MKEISADQITAEIKRLCIEANRVLPNDIKNAMYAGCEAEQADLPQQVMNDLVNNFKLAEILSLPVCQDTGMAVIFAEIGQEVHITGGGVEDAINEGVRQGYVEGLLRLSIVNDPIRRNNTGDNTPAIIHTRVVNGNSIKLTVAPKGFGSENMSRLKMLTPSASIDGIIDFVVETVRTAGGNPCPPVVIGVGIGGDFEYCALLAKKALIRGCDSPNTDAFYREAEQKMLEKINALNVGPQGFGGKTTALGVNIEVFATHIAGLPVAVNIGCHVTRHACAEILGE